MYVTSARESCYKYAKRHPVTSTYALWYKRMRYALELFKTFATKHINTTYFSKFKVLLIYVLNSLKFLFGMSLIKVHTQQHKEEFKLQPLIFTHKNIRML